jgi:hypothetical protein
MLFVALFVDTLTDCAKRMFVLTWKWLLGIKSGFGSLPKKRGSVASMLLSHKSVWEDLTEKKIYPALWCKVGKKPRVLKFVSCILIILLWIFWRFR